MFRSSAVAKTSAEHGFESSGLQLAGTYRLIYLVFKSGGMRSSGKKACEDWDSVREGKYGGSDYRDPRWVPGAICASVKAQSLDWTVSESVEVKWRRF